MKLKITVLFLLFCSIIKAEWTQTNGVYGGSISKIFSTNNKLFASTAYGSIYVSYDSGSTYIRRNDGLMDIHITSFTSIGNTVFAAGPENAGIFRTINDGLNWISVTSGLESNRVTCLASNGSNVFAGTGTSGMFVSSNFGANWIQINNGLTNTGISSITITHNIIFVACSNFEIFQSSDNGANWIKSFSGNNWNPFWSIASYDSTIIAAGIWTGICRSTNLGKSWERLDPTISWIIYSVGIRDSVICASADGQLNVSTNNGNNWIQPNELPQEATYNTILIDESFVFVSLGFRDGIDEFYGIYKSSNNGANWFPSSGNIIATYITTLFHKSGRVYSGTKYEGINYTTNNGNNWNEINNGLDHLYIYSIGSCDSILFSGTYSKLSRSINYGENWISTSTPNNIPFYTFFSNDSIILALSNLPYKSTNFGVSWFQSNSGYVGGYEGLGFAQIENYVFAASENALFRSTNFGEQWMKLLSHSGYSPITAIAANDDILFLGIQYPDTGIIMSSDSGLSFTFVNNGLTNKTIQALYSISNNVFAGTRGGVFVTNNNGVNWIPFNAGLGTLNITSFTDDSTYLFAGTAGSGVWKIPLSEILTEVNINSNIQTTFYLHQNYPNPFNPITKINYSIPTTQYTILKVYNVLGKEVSTLVNEKQNAGYYTIDFTATGLSSGIYFYTFKSGNFKETKRMILLK